METSHKRKEKVRIAEKSDSEDKVRVHTVRKPAPKGEGGSIGAPGEEWAWSTGLFPQQLSAIV